jgi:lysophospholipase L1-like esterase
LSGVDSAGVASSRWANLALVVVVSLLCAVGAEVALRLLRPLPLSFGYLSDEGVPIHVPGLSGVYRRSEFAAPVSFNSMGFRGEEFLLPKPSAEFRIVALGDSMTEGLQVSDDALFTRQIEVLSAERGLNVDVANLGVSGYGTDAALLAFEVYGAALEPDLVIVFFCMNNDARNNLLEGRCSVVNGELRCDPAQPPSRSQRRWRDFRVTVLRPLQLYQILRGAIHAVRVGDFGASTTLDVGGPGLGFGGLLHVVPEPQNVRDALDITGKLLEALRARAARAGAETWLVLLPMQHQIEDERWRTFARRDSGYRVERELPQQAMRALAASIDMPVIDLYEPFRATDAAGERLYWQLDAHFNEAGHRVTAEVVTARLREHMGPPAAASSAPGHSP